MSKPVVISTFSGCGGSSLGLTRAGFEVRVACEFMPKAAETYRANAPGVIVVEKDIREMTGEELLEIAGVKRGELDLFEGSPPCASFSRAATHGHKLWGTVKKYSAGKQRTDDLFFEFLRVAKDINPRAMLMENVKGLTQGRAKVYMHAFIREMMEMGYRVDARVYNAARYGVPQNRERLIFVCLRNDVKGEYVPPEPIPRTTLREAWAGVPSPSCDEEQGGNYGPGTKLGVLARVTREGESMERSHERMFGNESAYSHMRLHMDRQAPTMTAVAQCIHPKEDRIISIPELRRVCGFPDDFKLTGSAADRFERLGRAVPPPLYERIGRSILKALSQ